VQSSFSFFVTSYSRLAEWKAIVDRLSGFETQTQHARAASANCGIERDHGRAEAPLTLVDVHIATPEGMPLLERASFIAEAGKALLLTGPSGCGKTTLLRAICGFWPHARGRVTLAPGARVFVLPQRPYLPLGSLRAAVAYPAPEHSIADDRIRSVLAKVGLADHAGSLDRRDRWSDMLSLGEQQRIGFARAVLTKADVLLLDEATSALDEPSEAALFRLIRAELPNVAIVSIGHRSTLASLHHRTVDLNQRLAIAESA
jgi:putative ATP-binding cassette transporter